MGDLHFSLTCNCGVTITAINEKGLRKLMMKHIDDGQIHACWRAYYNTEEKTELRKILDTGSIFDEPKDYHDPR